MSYGLFIILALLIVSPTSCANLGTAGALVNGTAYHTVVVGGGIAGVTAAVNIAKAGKTVALLEVNDYLGGRLKSTPVPLSTGATLQFDQGASWIHGSGTQNPITTLSRSVTGLQGVVTLNSNMQTFNQDGSSADTQVDSAETIYRGVMDETANYATTDSIQSVFQAENSAALTNKYVMYHVASDVQFQYSGPISDISAAGQEDNTYPGDEFLILSGYQRFVSTLAATATFDTFLGKKVVTITRRNQDSMIQCDNGDYIIATHVVIAVPLGVLKAGTITFSPPLSAQKTAAISGLGFGNVCKILVTFNAGTSFTFPAKHYLGVVSNDVADRGLATYFLNLKQLANVPALMTFGLGADADEAQSMTQADLKTLIAARISAFSSASVAASDFTITRTSWRTNPNFQGTYTYASITTVANHWTDIQAAVQQNQWHFCGEHTNGDYRGTAHGAYLSGKRAAVQIVGQPKGEKLLTSIIKNIVVLLSLLYLLCCIY